MANEEVKNETKKSIYFLGTYPEKDWPRMFAAFILVLIIVIFMGTSMYFSYLDSAPVQTTGRVLSGNATTATDIIFDKYSKKEAEYEAARSSVAGELMVPDPSL